MPFVVSEEDPIFSPGKIVTCEMTPAQERCSNVDSAAFLGVPLEYNSSKVVDMGMAPVPLENAGHVPDRAQRLDCGKPIRFRKHITFREEDLTDYAYAWTMAEQEGNVKNGSIGDVCQMYKEQSPLMDKGVICNTSVLCSVNGNYNENEQYTVYPAKFRGGYGECAMCKDNTTCKTFMRKVVKGEWKNEVLVPLLFPPGTPGIPEVYGIIQRGSTVQILQKYAGESLDKLRQEESAYAKWVSSPVNVLGLAYQGFKTLERLHSKGVQHLDIKPENLCVDMGEKVPSLHLIDFGSCQMPGEVITQGFTFEYLSPEAASVCIRNGKLGENTAMEEGTDVWAMTLSLMYLLRGYHVMVRYFTKDNVYHGTKKEQEIQRVKTLLQIAKLTDECMASQIDPAWPAVLKDLFANTLRVDKKKRWTAQQAANFILAHITGLAALSGSMGQPTSMTISAVVQPARQQASQGQPSPSSSITAVQPAPADGFLGRSSASICGAVVQPAPPCGVFAQPAPVNSSTAIASLVRLRARPAQLEGAGRLYQWSFVAGVTPGIQQCQAGPSAACEMARKRRLQDNKDQDTAQLHKLIRK